MTGLFLVDKPAGPSSFGVLRQLRPVLGRKLGHAGTLDPFASGLLLVLAGRATRLARYLSGLDKSYRAVVQFGATSTTLDREGELEETGGSTDAEAVAAAAGALTGRVLQRVPAASAVHVDGQRAYARMRRGEEVDLPSREVHITGLQLVAFDRGAQRGTFDVTCSKGTYVRQIAADLGEATGAGAYCLELRRLTVGPFTVDDAVPPAGIDGREGASWFREPVDALPHLPLRELTEEEGERVCNGRTVGRDGQLGPTRLVRDGALLAVAGPAGDVLRPEVVLCP
jgi:tRNA pseudouridine55 synthase